MRKRSRQAMLPRIPSIFQTHSQSVSLPRLCRDRPHVQHRTHAEDGVQMRKLGVMFRDLRIVGVSCSAHSGFPILPPVDNEHTLRHPLVRDIISGLEGVVLLGEMLRLYTPFPAFTP